MTQARAPKIDEPDSGGVEARRAFADPKSAAGMEAGAPAEMRALPSELRELGRRAALLLAETQRRVQVGRSLLQRAHTTVRGGSRAAPYAWSQPPAQGAVGFPAVVIAASAGGLKPLLRIVGELPADFPAAVVVVQHRAADSHLAELLAAHARLPVRAANDGDPLRPGCVHVPPAGRHVGVQADGRLAVWEGARINFVCPSADLAFESLAASFGERGVAVVLSGAGSDGAMGSRAVRRAGGVVLAQRERAAHFPGMPTAAVEVGKVDLILDDAQIAPALVQLVSAPASALGTPPEQDEVRSGTRGTPAP